MVEGMRSNSPCFHEIMRNRTIHLPPTVAVASAQKHAPKHQKSMPSRSNWTETSFYEWANTNKWVSACCGWFWQWTRSKSSEVMRWDKPLDPCGRFHDFPLPVRHEWLAAVFDFESWWFSAAVTIFINNVNVQEHVIDIDIFLYPRKSERARTLFLSQREIYLNSTFIN